MESTSQEEAVGELLRRGDDAGLLLRTEGEGSEWDCGQGLWAWLRDPEVRDHDCRAWRACVMALPDRLCSLAQQAGRSRGDRVGELKFYMRG